VSTLSSATKVFEAALKGPDRLGHCGMKHYVPNKPCDVPTAAPALVCGSLARILDIAEQREPAVAWTFWTGVASRGPDLEWTVQLVDCEVIAGRELP